MLISSLFHVAVVLISTKGQECGQIPKISGKSGAMSYSGITRSNCHSLVSTTGNFNGNEVFNDLLKGDNPAMSCPGYIV
jgi:hypothetical protein